jgi:alpha-1,4-digalacturonate transport system substrate-binding protein
VPLPGDNATWEDWAKAAQAVATKTQAPFPIAIDRSGHRFYAITLSQGTKIFRANGEPIVVDEGFKRAAQLIYDWHRSGIMSKELWGSVSGTAYRGANEEFKNAQVVLYLSGSWQTSQFDKTVGNAFDWMPCRTPAQAAAAMPSGAGLVAFKGTQHPRECRGSWTFGRANLCCPSSIQPLFVPGHLWPSPRRNRLTDGKSSGRRGAEVLPRTANAVSPSHTSCKGLHQQPHHLYSSGDQPPRPGHLRRNDVGTRPTSGLARRRQRIAERAKK